MSFDNEKNMSDIIYMAFIEQILRTQFFLMVVRQRSPVVFCDLSEEQTESIASIRDIISAKGIQHTRCCTTFS